MKKQLKTFVNNEKKTNSLKTVGTWLPLFTGFYNSIFDCSDNYIEYETELSEDEFKEYYENLHKSGVTKEYFDSNLYDYLDYRKGEQGASEYICGALINLEHAGIIKDVDFEKVVSPKFYNFSTDAINCDITYNSKKLMKYLEDNKDALETYISDKYTSCSGFISSYSNDVEYWMDEDNHDAHEVGSLLQFVLLNESKDAVMDLYYESNCSEGFSNSVVFNENKMIEDFKKSAA